MAMKIWKTATTDAAGLEGLLNALDKQGYEIDEIMPTQQFTVVAWRWDPENTESPTHNPDHQPTHIKKTLNGARPANKAKPKPHPIERFMIKEILDFKDNYGDEYGKFINYWCKDRGYRLVKDLNRTEGDQLLKALISKATNEGLLERRNNHE